MQVKKTNSSDTEVLLSITASQAEIAELKAHVLTHFADKVKLPGFRAGKVPHNLLEKNVDPTSLQTEFLEEAISQLYQQAAINEQLRVIGRPEITIKKFVPFSVLEFDAAVPVIGKIVLGDYKKIRLTPTKVTVSKKDVDEVVSSLQKRAAKKTTVDRAAAIGDEVWIDFKGTDTKGNPVNGADGKDYPLILGSNTFIPGFEANVTGMKAGETKDFTLTFPKDYGVKALANKKVAFAVTVTKVQELEEPARDDAFAASVGPFKTYKALVADIEKQLTVERQREADRDDESRLVQKISAVSKVSVPPVLIEDTIEQSIRELKQNLVYRGITYEEFLKGEGKTDEAYRKELEPSAHERVKAGLVLSEIADQEKLQVTPEELEIRIQILKGQYQDAAMQAELDKPENRRDIASRMLTEKVLQHIKERAFKK